MITSRKQGILVLNTSVPYKIAKNGIIDEVSEVICHEFTYNVENVASDIEQMFFRAIMSLSKNISDEAKNKHSEKDEEKDTLDFFNNDCPDEEKIAENAKGLEVIVKMSDVNISDITKQFEKFVNAGLICAEGDIKMSVQNIWNTISRKDRLDIMFKYIAFFVKPLARQ